MLPWAAKVVADHRAKQGAEDFEARCLPGGPPRAAPYHTALFATPKLVLMLFEGNTHMYRQFFVDGSSHPKDLKPTFYGDSRAHWEGDTLVVDTVGFFEKSWYDFAGTPHTKDMHLIEKFHRSDYGNMDMQVTIEYPGALTKPWVINRTTTLEPSFEITEYVCNENNQDPEHLDATLKTDAPASAKKDQSKPKGVPPVQARKPPAPPSGPTPHMQDGKVDLSGVWVPTSIVLPGDPSYQPLAKKIYDERKANKGKDDPMRLPDGAVRLNPGTRSCNGPTRLYALGGKHPQLQTIFSMAGSWPRRRTRELDRQSIGNGKAIPWLWTLSASTTNRWTRPASRI